MRWFWQGGIKIPRGQIFRIFDPLPHRGQTWSFGQPPQETTLSIQNPLSHRTIRKLKISYIFNLFTFFFQKFVTNCSNWKFMQAFSDLMQNTTSLFTWPFWEPSPLVAIHCNLMKPPPPSLTTWYMDAPNKMLFSILFDNGFFITYFEYF